MDLTFSNGLGIGWISAWLVAWLISEIIRKNKP